MPDQSTALNLEAHQQLENIEVQRHALEQLLKVTRSVDSLRSGIETTILLGKATGHTSEKAMNLYKLLDKKTHNLSNHEVHLRLKRIDKNIEKRLSETINTVEHLQDTGISEENEKNMDRIHHLTDDFKRSTQTMTALQVLLNIRGLTVKPRIFSLSQQVLQEKIVTIKTRERHCHQKIIAATLTMEKDISVLLKSENCANKIRPVLQHVLTGLKSNRRHIEQGLDIHDLPYEIDLITLTDSDSQVTYNETKKDAIEGSGENTTQPEPEGHTQEKSNPKGIGIIEGLRLWLNTPMNVSLRDIFKK
jgi:uncharacterized protein (DUF2344 family)